ncbi:MAG: hypothetical protein ABSG50_15735, partial [Opitutaceae bacterium]
EHKVIIFSEFASTARYLRDELTKAGIRGIDQTDSGSKRDRAETITRFAPYYNESSSAELSTATTVVHGGGSEIMRVTDYLVLEHSREGTAHTDWKWKNGWGDIGTARASSST